MIYQLSCDKDGDMSFLPTLQRYVKKNVHPPLVQFNLVDSKHSLVQSNLNQIHSNPVDSN